MRRSRYAGWMLLVFALSARADIYRCNGALGEPSFSHRPCAGGSTFSVPGAQSGTRDAVGVRPAERAWLEQRQRGRGSRKTRPAEDPAAAKRKTDAAAYRCQRKRRLLEAVRDELRRGYKPARGEKLRRRQRGYEDYLAAFCR